MKRPGRRPGPWRRACAPPAPRTAGAGSRPRRARTRSTPGAAGAPPRRAAAGPPEAARDRPPRGEQSEVPAAAGPSRGRTAGVVLQRARRAPPTLPQRQGQLELGRAARQRSQGASPGSSGAGRVLMREHHLEQRRSREVPLRPQLLDQPLEGQVLVGEGPEPRLAHPASSSAKPGSPARSPRSTSVLTKKPISPSISLRPRSRPASPRGGRPARVARAGPGRRPAGS